MVSKIIMVVCCHYVCCHYSHFYAVKVWLAEIITVVYYGY